MDYGVKYNILVNGISASQEFTKFADTVSSLQPKIVKDFSVINTSITKTIGLLKELNLLLKGQGAARKISIDTSQTDRELTALKKKLALIKSKTITVTTNTATTSGGGGGTSRPSTRGGGGGRGSRPVPVGISASKMMPTGFMAGLGLPMIAMGGMALAGRGIQTMIKDAAVFEDTMTSVKNILKTGDKEAATFDNRFASVSKTIQKVGVDTKFTSTEIAGAAKYLAMAGMNLSNVQSAMRPVANLAALSDAPIDRVADTVTNIMSGFNIQADGIQGVSDIIAAASISTNTNVLEMAEAFKFASAPLSLARIRFEEGAAAIGILANAGIKGTLAGTAIRAMMIRLIAPTTKAQKTLSRLGVTTTEVVDGVEKVKDIATVFKDLKKANATVEDLYKIFDKIGGNAATALYTYTDRLVELTKAAQYSGGIAGFLAEEKMKTIIGLTDQISSQIQFLSQTAFSAIEPVIKQYMNEFLGWLKTPDAAGFFTTVADGIRSTIVALSEVSRFIYNNWDWLKWLLGGKMIFSGAKNIITSIMSIASALASAGTVATGTAITLKAVGAGILAIVTAPIAIISAIAAAIGLIGFKAYQAKSNYDTLVGSTQTSAKFQTLEDLKAALDDVNSSANSAKKSMDDLVKERLSKMPVEGKGFTGFLQGGMQQKDLLSTWLLGAILPGVSRSDLRTGLANDERRPFYEAGALSSAKDMVGLKYGGQMEKLQTQFFGATANERGNIINSISAQAQNLANKNVTASISTMKFIPGTTGRADLEKTKEYNQFSLDFLNSQIEWAKIMSPLMDSAHPGDIMSLFRSQGAIPAGAGEDYFYGASEQDRPTKVQAAFQNLIGKGFKTDDLVKKFQVLDLVKYLRADPHQTFSSDPNITTPETMEEALKRMAAEDRVTGGGGGGGLSGTGRISGSGAGKSIIVNIQNLMAVEHANLQGKDLEEMKDTMAQALMDIVKEFEISYS